MVNTRQPIPKINTGRLTPKHDRGTIGLGKMFIPIQQVGDGLHKQTSGKARPPRGFLCGMVLK